MEMNPYLRNALAFLGGILAGSLANFTALYIMMKIVGMPPGVDISDMDTIIAAMPDFKTIHFLPPLVAHATGALVGAYITARFVTRARMFFGFMVGVIFLMGGIMSFFQIPGTPLWFTVIDLTVCYLPMAIIGVKLTGKRDE